MGSPATMTILSDVFAISDPKAIRVVFSMDGIVFKNQK